SKGPLKRKALAALLNIDINDEDSWEALRRRLKAMVRDGQLIKRKNGYLPIGEGFFAPVSKCIQGKLKFDREGGMVWDKTINQKAWLSPRELKGLCEGDTLEVRLTGQHYKQYAQGIVERVLDC